MGGVPLNSYIILWRTTERVRTALQSIGLETDFSVLYTRFLAVRFNFFQSKVDKQVAADVDQINEDALMEQIVRDFHWQQFLAEGM